MSRPVHFEIHAENPDRAMAFYKAVFGWTFQKFGTFDYWTVTTGSEEEPGINGGLIRRQGSPPGPQAPVHGYVCTISVVNVDTAAEAVRKAQGLVVVPKMSIPGVGWLVYCKDTESNIFGIMHEDREAK